VAVHNDLRGGYITASLPPPHGVERETEPSISSALQCLLRWTVSAVRPADDCDAKALKAVAYLTASGPSMSAIALSEVGPVDDWA
jgi:hypothetical protein